MTTSTAPFPYSMPYALQMEPDRTPGAMPLFSTVKSMSPLCGPTYLDERALMERLDKIPSELNRHGWNAQYTLPARLEFLYKDSLEGLLIFDSFGTLIVHLLTPKLGYGGRGGQLAQQILKAVGAYDDVYEQINAELTGLKPYMIVISREERTVEDGEEIALRTMSVRDTWTWWHAG